MAMMGETRVLEVVKRDIPIEIFVNLTELLVRVIKEQWHSNKVRYFQSLNSYFQSLNSYFQSLNSYFESLNSYFQSLNSYFQSLNSYFQCLNSYFETVADTGGGGGGGYQISHGTKWYQISQFVLFRSKWNKETHQYISI